jgi:uncharacterized membrane protein
MEGVGVEGASLLLLLLPSLLLLLLWRLLVLVLLTSVGVTATTAFVVALSV